ALAHRHRVEVEEDVGEHDHHAVAAVARRRVAEDALPDLAVADEVTDGHACVLYLDERLGVGPLAALELELLALVHDDLAVVADADAPALQRPGGGALEVDAGDVEAAAVA